MPFDARTVKLMQPGEHIAFAEHPGLRIIASASRRTWQYRYKSPLDGLMKKFKLGEWPKVDYHEAVGEWKKVRERRQAGEDPARQKKADLRAKGQVDANGEPGPYLVKHLVQDYLAGHIERSRKEAGRREVRRILERHTAKIADREAAHLLRSEAYEVIESLAATPVIAGQVRREMGAAYAYGLDSGKLPDVTPNWWRLIMRGTMPRSKGKKIEGKHVGTKKRALNERELGELINWLPNFSKTIADALTLYLWTDTRGAEIMALEKKEVTEEPTGLWWTIPKEKTKNARHDNATDLRVPLVGRAKAVVLRRMQQTDRWLFQTETGEDKPMEQKRIQSGVYHHQPYCKTSPKQKRPRLPVTHWSPHDLRRSIRTLLASMGCPEEIAEAIMGHMKDGMVGVYNVYGYDAERREWLTKLDVKLEQLAQQYQLGVSAS
jgi:integrase